MYNSFATLSVFFSPSPFSAYYSAELVSLQSALQPGEIRPILAGDWIGIDNRKEEKEGERELMTGKGRNALYRQMESRLNELIEKWMAMDEKKKKNRIENGDGCQRRCLPVSDGRAAHEDIRRIDEEHS